jgi:hypothetical protein
MKIFIIWLQNLYHIILILGLKLFIIQSIQKIETIQDMF